MAHWSRGRVAFKRQQLDDLKAALLQRQAETVAKLARVDDRVAALDAQLAALDAAEAEEASTP